jgi:UDP-N-acetylmuramoylalanine--D-glutamate ligase
MSLVLDVPKSFIPTDAGREFHGLSENRISSVDKFGIDWKAKTILVVGLGKSGVSSARFLSDIGCNVRVSDGKDSDALRQSVDFLKNYGIVQIELGGHSRNILTDCDCVVASPGVPENSPIISWAQETKVPIISEIELAFRFCRAPIVAVTGTNGKSTAVTLIQRILEASRIHAVACGNLGVPFTECLSSLTPDSIAVVEVSSFQLMWCHQFRPTIAVLLNISTNHLDRHPSIEHYSNAKAKLFANQTPQDFAVVNANDASIAVIAEKIFSKKVWFGDGSQNEERFMLDDNTCRLLAPNLQAVLQVGRILGIAGPLIYQALREFRGLEHRIEHVENIHGVHFINDSKSTTPESVLYAISRCKGNLVLIVGGKDKGMDASPLRGALTEERIRGVILIGQTRIALKELFLDKNNVVSCESLHEAIRKSLNMARPGDTVLFSPGFASFDMFKNFEDRGKLFKQEVRSLLGQAPAI